MTEDPDDRELERLGGALRAERGECPQIERLTAHARGELGAGEDAEVGRHVALCPDCAELLGLAIESADDDATVDDLVWRRAERALDARATPWAAGPAARARWRRRLGAVAAVIVAALAAALWLAREQRIDTPLAAATRGSSLRPVAPIGSVDRVAAFRWQAPPVDLRFEVEVEHAGLVVWHGAVQGSSLPAPPELLSRLHRGASYRWRVRARAEDDRIVLESGWTEFELTPTRP